MDDAEAVSLAAEYEPTAGLAAETLLPLWSRSPDSDTFSAVLLAPAFAREGREELRLNRCSSLVGLRHLTMLRRLELRSKKVTDITEIGALTGLTDLGAFGTLPSLRDLQLSQLRQARNIEALLNAPALEKLSVRGSVGQDGDRFRIVADRLRERGGEVHRRMGARQVPGATPRLLGGGRAIRRRNLRRKAGSAAPLLP